VALTPCLASAGGVEEAVKGGAAVADTDRAVFDTIILQRVIHGVGEKFVLYRVYAVVQGISH
jgi:hypothetical protein